MVESAQRVRSILQGFENVRVWVIGDSMLDEYVEGEVGRISPDAPVQVVHVDRTDYRLGGAANVAHGIRMLGGHVELLSVVGDDAPGRTLRALCEQAKINVTALGVEDRRQTIRKVRVVARKQHVLRLDWERVIAVPDALRSSLLEQLKDSAPRPDVIVLSDYAKGLLSRDFVARVVSWATRFNIPVLVDPKTTDFSFYRGATMIKPNRKEVEEAVGVRLRDEASWYDEHIRPMIDSSDLDAMLITLGEAGMALVQRKHDVVRIETQAREVFDVTGAGDTVIGALALAVASGCDWWEAAMIANHAAGIAIGKVGTAVVTRRELATALSPSDRLGLLDLATLVEQVQWWRLQGRTIAFTNGCFDVLHAGHLGLLRAAAEQADVLIVGLNDDDSVSRLKGPDRPLNSVAERAEMLAAIECVDAVVTFGEDTPAMVIDALKPDVLVKGGDYSVDQVVGRETVEAAGGTVVIVPLVPNKSTSGMIDKIRTAKTLRED